jgi:hypothetical protein
MGKTVITAEPGMSQIIVTREFDAPRDSGDRLEELLAGLVASR